MLGFVSLFLALSVFFLSISCIFTPYPFRSAVILFFSFVIASFFLLSVGLNFIAILLLILYAGAVMFLIITLKRLLNIFDIVSNYNINRLTLHFVIFSFWFFSYFDNSKESQLYLVLDSNWRVLMDYPLMSQSDPVMNYFYTHTEHFTFFAALLLFVTLIGAQFFKRSR